MIISALVARRRRAVAGALLLLAAAGCSPPLRVERVPAEEYYRDQTASALSSDDVSELTRTVLRRHALLERYEDQTDQTIDALRTSLLQGDGGSDEIFALAELSLYRAQKRESASHYLAAAVYAYAFGLPDDPSQRPIPLDPRTRMAADIYNRALAQALQSGKSDTVTLQAGTYPLPFGQIAIAFDDQQLWWHDYRLTDFTPVGERAVIGLRNRYRAPGIGAPLAARPAPVSGTYGFDELIGPNVRVPVTAVLRIEHPRRQILTSSLAGTLEAHESMDERTVEIDGHPVALEAEPTTVIASALVASRVWEAEYASFLGNPIALKPKPSILRGLQPYARGKIPVVFVHGTASSVLRWADMMNDLLDDARIRGAFQFWFFAYDSGNPIAYSSYLLRKALSDRVAEFERDAPDPALHQMVVIGHSQGGLLTKMTAIDSGDRLWSNVSRTPLKDLRLSDETRALLQDALFIKPLPFVKRLVFICTPHRGSYLAGPQIVRRLIHRLVTLPGDLVASSAEIVGAMREGGLVDVDRLPTSIDNMDPGNRFIKALQEIPIDPGVKTHSIIAVTQTKDIEHGDDGVVKYQSAHIADVESELVVNSSHSAQANPHTIGEVKRILLEHLRVFQASAPVSHRPIARRHAHAR